MMAWGQDCSSWDDSVDMENLKAHDYGEVPESDVIMTTWHDDEPLKDVFWFSKYSAVHPKKGRLYSVVIHISDHDRRSDFLARYEKA